MCVLAVTLGWMPGGMPALAWGKGAGRALLQTYRAETNVKNLRSSLEAMRSGLRPPKLRARCGTERSP